MIKVISRGEKNGIKTAQIVILVNGKSFTKHVWLRSGSAYGDYRGELYNIK